MISVVAVCHVCLATAGIANMQCKYSSMNQLRVPPVYLVTAGIANMHYEYSSGIELRVYLRGVCR